MDKSKLPNMVKRSMNILLGGPKPKKKTKPGAVDDNAMKRVKKRRNQLKDAMKP